MSNPTPATVHARLCAYVDSQPGASETARLNAAARSLYVTRNAVWRWMHGERKTPMWLENALNWLERDNGPTPHIVTVSAERIEDGTPVTLAVDGHPLNIPVVLGGVPESDIRRIARALSDAIDSDILTRYRAPTPVSDTPTSAEKDAPNGRCDSCGAPFSMAQPDYPALCAECDTPTEE